MSSTGEAKKRLDQARKYLDQLKEIEFHTKGYLEKLAKIELDMVDELGQEKQAERVSDIFCIESKFFSELKEFIDDYEMACNRRKQQIAKEEARAAA